MARAPRWGGDNRPMSRILQVASVQLNDLGCACVCVATIALAACSPSLNWREVHPGGSELKALLPCQPDEATRVQQIGASSQELHMLGCEAAGGLYALASTPLAPGATTAQAQELQIIADDSGQILVICPIAVAVQVGAVLPPHAV